MNYIRDAGNLSNILNTLSTHSLDVKQYFSIELSLRVATLRTTEDKLIRLFILANADRFGTGKDNENLVKAVATFRKLVSENILIKLEAMGPRDAHLYLLTCLCDIKGMDQKTANLFLKYLVMFQDDFKLGKIDWHSWEPYLHVPLDLWVLRLIGKNYLNICENIFEEDFCYKGNYVSPSFKAAKYQQLQAEIREVASVINQPAIILDSLWLVGSKYCSYHPLLCDVCWLGQYCANHKIVDWSGVPARLKSTEKEEHKQIIKTMREVLRIWKSENPGKTDDNFFEFLKEPHGKEWLNKFTKKEKLFHVEFGSSFEL